MKTLVQKFVFFPLVYNKALCCTQPTRYSSHGSLPIGMDSSHESLFNSCWTLPTRLLQWDFLFFFLKERKEKVHSSKVAHSCTIGNKVALREKTLKSFNTNVKWTIILAYCKRSYFGLYASTSCIFGACLECKRKRETLK
jgi:hypothetical protein